MPHRDDHAAALARADAMARERSLAERRADELEAELARERARADAAETALARRDEPVAIVPARPGEPLAGRSNQVEGRVAFAIVSLIITVIGALALLSGP